MATDPVTDLRTRSALRLLTEREGKRSVRRRENAKFAHNPHVSPPTSLDLAHPLPQLPLSTFPHPLPSYLPRTLHVPPARPPPTLTSTSTAGLFSLSLRGARRALRTRPSSPFLVKAIEAHLATWLDGGTYLNPDQAKGLLSFPGVPVGGRDDIKEVGREAGRLVWAVRTDPADQQPGGYGDGGFERYVVHCVARWYGLVSFSKETDGRRLTYLLRPNVTRPDPRTDAPSRTLDTPPTTDISDFQVSDASPSDFHTADGSDYDPTNASDVDSPAGDLPTRADARPVLSDIDESRSPSPDLWSVGGSNIAAADYSDGGDLSDDRGFAASMESLSLSSVPADVNYDDDGVPTPDRLQSTIANTEEEGDIPIPSRARARADRDRLRRLYPRSASSPSPVGRSPHRFPISRNLGARRKRKARKDKKGFAGAMGTDKGSFYDYLFA